MNAAEMTALANEVIVARLWRCQAVGATPKGRVLAILPGPPCEAELRWEAITAEALRARTPRP